MKKQTKEQLHGGCMEAVGELVLYLIFFGIGILVVGLFGGNTALDEVDPEWIVLLGILALGIVVAVIAGIVTLFKRKQRPEKSTENDVNEVSANKTENAEDGN